MTKDQVKRVSTNFDYLLHTVRHSIIQMNIALERVETLCHCIREAIAAFEAMMEEEEDSPPPIPEN